MHFRMSLIHILKPKVRIPLLRRMRYRTINKVDILTRRLRMDILRLFRMISLEQISSEKFREILRPIRRMHMENKVFQKNHLGEHLTLQR